MLRDRHRLRRALRSLRPTKDFEKADARLQQLTEQVEASAAEADRRRARLPVPNFDLDLPVVHRREEIADAIRDNQVVVICGETGSGKTTQLPKICLDLGRGVTGLIGHTQPRRIAARSVANRLRDELNNRAAVGFKVRFTDETSPDSFIKLMTDGILLAETQSDRFLEKYDTIIIDEAHERSLNIDFLLGYLKRLLPKRPDLKLIITSATIDPDRFSRHFDGAPVVMVTGRTFPVEVRYRPLMSEDEDAQTFEMTDALLAAVDELGRATTGDTLVFLTGERDIRETADALRKHTNDRLDVLPLYARLSAEEQMRVFRPTGRRRVVLATNVAETSLTVPGITGVIDTGLARISRYSTRNRLQRLPIEPVSQASADQRKGRCGRVSEGVCIRLYSEEDFEKRPRYTDPEILRTNLASVILQMKAFKLGDVEDFPFLDPPDYRQVRDGYQTLFEINAIDANNDLTDAGRILARLPVDPRLGRMLMAAKEENCLEELLALAAALSIQDPRERPMDKRHEADDAHAQFREAGSDFLALLNLWRFWRDTLRQLSQSQARKRCKQLYLSYTRMREWADIHRQLIEYVAGFDWRLNREPAAYDAVHRALLTGLLANVGRKIDQVEYQGVRGRRFFIFPGSGLFQKKPNWLMAGELVETTKVYARTCASIQPEWIEHVAADLVKRTHTDPHWQRKTARVMAYERVTLYGLPVVNKRSVPLAPIDPKQSRSIFIRSALVEMEYDTGAPFFRHNAQLIRDVELLEAKGRRRDIMVDADTRFAWYDARVPAQVVGGQSFDKWRRAAEHDNRRLLFMEPEDLMARVGGELGGEQFPDKLVIPQWHGRPARVLEGKAADAGGTPVPQQAAAEFDLSYRFDPGHAFDGVTVTLPLAALNQIPADRLDWLVPGLIEEKALDLIRTMPKALRVNFVPAPDFARRAVHRMPFGQGNLPESLAAALGKLSGLSVRAENFSPDGLPDYLRMNVRVIDEHAKQVAVGRDLKQLRQQLRGSARDAFAITPPPPYDRDGITAWDFGDLPERVELRQNGTTLQGFPSLVDRGGAVSLRLLETPDLARDATRRGVRRLFLIDYAKELRHLIDTLPAIKPMGLHYAPLGPGERLKDQIREAVADRLVADIPKRVRTKEEFTIRLETAWNRLRPLAEEVGDIAAKSLARRHDLALKLEAATAPLMNDAVHDLRRQVAELVPPDFLTATPLPWLPHLPRYLRAAQVRLDKLLNAGLKRDANAAATLAPLLLAYREKISADPDAARSAEMVQTRWMLEELRVQLFAQELGTAIPVSAKKVERQLEAVAA